MQILNLRMTFLQVTLWHTTEHFCQWIVHVQQLTHQPFQKVTWSHGGKTVFQNEPLSICHHQWWLSDSIFSILRSDHFKRDDFSLEEDSINGAECSLDKTHSVTQLPARGCITSPRTLGCWKKMMNGNDDSVTASNGRDVNSDRQLRWLSNDTGNGEKT